MAKRKDPVTLEMRAEILRRDGMCVLAKKNVLGHVCHDQWGVPHSPYDLDRMSIEHVPLDYGCMGKRGAGLIAICHGSNEAMIRNGKVVMGNPTREIRQVERDYLREIDAVRSE